MQRLFSTFPNSWPGAGLLLLRCCLATALICCGVAEVSDPSPTIFFAQDLIAAAAAIFLLAGLWTPLMAVLAAMDKVWVALSLRSQSHEQTWVHIFLAVLSVSVAMLGPGAWSIDARLFGRKRFDIERATGKKRYL